MHKPRLRDLVAELFRTHGFEVTVDAALEGRSGALYTAPVLAEQGDYAILIERVGANESVQASAVAELANVVEDVGAEQGLLVYLGGIDDDARGAGAGRVVLWNQDTLTGLIGNAYLTNVEGVQLLRLPLEATSPILESRTQIVGDEVLPAAFADDEPFTIFDGPAVEESEPESFGGIDFAALETLGDEAPTPPAPAPTTNAALPVLAPRVSVDQAVASVRDRLYLVESHALVLQPVHVLDYECDLLIEGSLRYDTVQGRLEVHGTRKDVREVDRSIFDPRVAGPPPSGSPIDERTLRVSHERAIEISRDAIMEAHTRVVEIETTDASEDVSITERKQVAPRPDHVRLQHLGTVHRPIWRLAGPNGMLLVDALSGETVSEELRSSDPGVVMLD